MDIRAATTHDARAIAGIHVDAWRAAYQGLMPDDVLANLSIEKRESIWRSAIERGEPSVLVAVDESQVVGWIAFGPCRDADGPPGAGEIWAVYARPDRWSRGVGRALWLAAREAMVANRFQQVTLWVLATNDRARRFYRIAGFLEDREGRKSAEFGGVVLDEIRLVAPLSGGSA